MKIFESIKDFFGVKSTNQLVDEFIKLSKSESLLKDNVSNLAKSYVEKLNDFELNKKYYSGQPILSKVNETFNEFTKSHLIELSELKNDISNIKKRKNEILKKDKLVFDIVEEKGKRDNLLLLKSKISADKLSIILKSLGDVKLSQILIINEFGEYLVLNKLMSKEKYFLNDFIFDNTNIEDIVFSKIGVKVFNIQKYAEVDNTIYYLGYLNTSEHPNIIVNGDEDSFAQWMSLNDIIYCEHISKDIRRDLIKINYPLDKEKLELVKSINNIEIKKRIIKVLSEKYNITKYDELQKSFDKISEILGDNEALKLIEKSWSGDLSKKYSGARWITLKNGQHVMIRDIGGGKAKIVYAGDSALEHLELDFNKKKDPDKNVNVSEKERNKQQSKEKSKLKKEVNQQFINKLKDIIGVDTESKKKANESIENLPNKEKKEFIRNIHEYSKEKAIKGQVAGAVGGDAFADIFGDRPLLMPDKNMQNILDGMQLTPEQNMDILLNFQTLKEQSKLIEKQFKNNVTPDKELSKELADILSRNVDSESVIKSIIEEEFEKKASEERISTNMTFYDMLEENKEKKTVSSAVTKGALDALNNISQFLKSDDRISKKTMDLLGVKNAAILLSHNLNKEDAEKLAAHIEKTTNEQVKKQISEIQNRQAQINETKKDIAEGTIYQANFGLAAAKVLKKSYEDLGNLAGETNGAAEFYNSLLSDKKEIIINGGTDVIDMKNKLKSLGISESDASFVKNIDGTHDIVILADKFDNLLKSAKGEAKRDDFVRKMKNGELIEKDWKPEMANVPAMDAQQEGIKWALNRKRSILDFGAGLGKTYTYMGIVSELKSKGEMKDNFAVIAVPSKLRGQFQGNGDQNNLSDREKYFPGMKVASLDEFNNAMPLYKRKEAFPDISEAQLKSMSGQELKQELINSAKKGNYDFLLTGHDTMKDKETVDLIHRNKPKALIVDEAHEAISGEGTSDRYSAVKKMSEGVDYFTAGTGTLIRNSVKDLGAIVEITDPTKTKAKKFAEDWEKKINKGSSLFLDQTVNNFRKEFDDVILSRSAKVEYRDDKGNIKTPKIIEHKNTVQLSKEQSDRYKEIEHSFEQENKLRGKFGLYDKEKGTFVFGGDNKLLNSTTKKEFSGQVKDSKGRYSVKELGGQDSSMRKEMNHKKNLYAGNHNENAKVKSMIDTIKNSEGKHIIYYDTQTTEHAKKTLLEALQKQLGLQPNQISTIDGSVKIGNDRSAQQSKFNTDPNVKVMLMNSAGATGLNLQSADHVHIYSRPNTYAEQNQLVARAMRKGRNKDVNVHTYDTNTPFERNKANIIDTKKKISEAIGEYHEY